MHKYLIMTMCMVVLILFLGISVNAESGYGFETTDLSPDEINQIWNSIKVRSLPETLSLDEMSTSIVSFDVSESENILIGLKNNRLIVLDNNKELLYGFQFSNDGSFYVRWEGDNILLLLVRGAIIVEFSTNGQLINMIEADDRSIENNDLWNQIRDRDKVSINDSVYLVRNQMGFLNFFSSSYSQLVKKDIDGKEMVIYDVSTVHTTKTAVMLIAVLLFWGLIISVIIWKSRKNVEVGEDKIMKKNYKILIGILLIEYFLLSILNKLNIQINSKVGTIVGIILIFMPVQILLYLLSRDFQISMKARILSKALFFSISIWCLAGIIVKLLGVSS